MVAVSNSSQGFPIEHDNHLLTVLRYMERNSMKALSIQSETVKVKAYWICGAI
jgi:hypothetical protein